MQKTLTVLLIFLSIASCEDHSFGTTVSLNGKQQPIAENTSDDTNPTILAKDPEALAFAPVTSSSKKYTIIEISLPLSEIQNHVALLSKNGDPLRKITVISRSDILNQSFVHQLRDLENQFKVVVDFHLIGSDWLTQHVLKDTHHVGHIAVEDQPLSQTARPRTKTAQTVISYLLKPVRGALHPLLFVLKSGFPKNNSYGYVEPNQFMRITGGVVSFVSLLLAVSAHWMGMMYDQNYNVFDLVQMLSRSSNVSPVFSGHNVHLFLAAAITHFYLISFHSIWGKTWLNVLNRVKFLGFPGFARDFASNVFKGTRSYTPFSTRTAIDPKKGEIHQLVFNFGYTAFWFLFFRTLAHIAHPTSVTSVWSLDFLQDFLFLSVGQSIFSSLGVSGLNNLYQKGYYSQNGKFVRLMLLDLFMLTNGLLLAYRSDWLYVTAPVEWSLKFALAVFGYSLPAIKRLFLLDPFVVRKGVDVSGNLPFQLSRLYSGPQKQTS